MSLRKNKENVDTHSYLELRIHMKYFAAILLRGLTFADRKLPNFHMNISELQVTLKGNNTGRIFISFKKNFPI